MTKSAGMDPNHPKWSEFIERLEGPEGCNFRKNSKGETVWDCAGGDDKSFAEKILNSIGNIDIIGTLEFFEQYGGYCDCEILMNVADGFEEAVKFPAKIERKKLKQKQKQSRKK